MIPGVLVSGDGVKVEGGNEGATGVEDTGEFPCDNCDQVFYSLSKLLYHSNFECSAVGKYPWIKLIDLFPFGVHLIVPISCYLFLVRVFYLLIRLVCYQFLS